MVEPLTGFTIGITSERRADEQAAMLTSRGARVLIGSMLNTAMLHDLQATLAATRAIISEGVDFVVLSTGFGTRSWVAAVDSAGLGGPLLARLNAARVLARGPKARSAAIAAGIDVAWSAPGEVGTEIVERLAQIGVVGQRIAVQRDGGEPLLAAQIAALGAEVVDVAVYEWNEPVDPGPARRLLAAVIDGRLDAVTFTSKHAVDSAFALGDSPTELADAFNGRTRAVAVGPVTGAALRHHGVTTVVEPGRARLGPMVHAVVDTLQATRIRLSLGPATAILQGGAIVTELRTNAHPPGEPITAGQPTPGAHPRIQHERYVPPVLDTRAGGGPHVEMLTGGERRILQTLLERSPGVVPRQDLGSSGRAIEMAVARIRTKLGPLGEGIVTVPRRGYASSLAASPAP